MLSRIRLPALWLLVRKSIFAQQYCLLNRFMKIGPDNFWGPRPYSMTVTILQSSMPCIVKYTSQAETPTPQKYNYIMFCFHLWR